MRAAPGLSERTAVSRPGSARASSARQLRILLLLKPEHDKVEGTHQHTSDADEDYKIQEIAAKIHEQGCPFDGNNPLIIAHRRNGPVTGRTSGKP